MNKKIPFVLYNAGKTLIILPDSFFSGIFIPEKIIPPYYTIGGSFFQAMCGVFNFFCGKFLIPVVYYLPL
ncbi:MAG: hypothetical protein E7058_03280 [Lentisphaerae bacterium]|nr:hypothetical protein [Lentisphaerota bacterium]